MDKPRIKIIFRNGEPRFIFNSKWLSMAHLMIAHFDYTYPNLEVERIDL